MSIYEQGDLEKAKDVLRSALRENLGIRIGVWWTITLFIGSLTGLGMDHRLILGLNPWVKPIKFEISIVIFLITIALMLKGLNVAGRWKRTRTFLGWGFSAAMIVEISIISLQSFRGVRSHMNFDTPLNGHLFAVMGKSIIFNTLLVLWLLILWCFPRIDLPAAVRWGVRLGLAMLLIGSAEGVRIVLNGGHTVGAVDGGPGLPFLNWSRQHGDLRAAHFFALHALEIFPVAGLLLARTRIRDTVQIVLLLVFTFIYSAGVWWLFTEALRGIPVTRY